jgi:hypothetical protein
MGSVKRPSLEYPAPTEMGHEDSFPRPRPSGRYRFRKRSLCCQRTGCVGFWVKVLYEEAVRAFVHREAGAYFSARPCPRHGSRRHYSYVEARGKPIGDSAAQGWLDVLAGLLAKAAPPRARSL